jgi:hypothetical protein
MSANSAKRNDKQGKRPTGLGSQPKWRQDLCKTLSRYTSDSDNQAFKGEGDAFYTVEKRTPDYQNPCHDSLSEGSTPMSEGDAFRGISSQESQDWLIGIEPRL